MRSGQQIFLNYYWEVTSILSAIRTGGSLFPERHVYLFLNLVYRKF